MDAVCQREGDQRRDGGVAGTAFKASHMLRVDSDRFGGLFLGEPFFLAQQAKPCPESSTLAKNRFFERGSAPDLRSAVGVR